MCCHYNAAMSMGLQHLFELVFLFPLDIVPEVELLAHTVVLFLIFEAFPYCFPQRLYQFTIPPIPYKSSLFSTPKLAFVLSCFFGKCHSNGHDVISHYGFNLILLMTGKAKLLFMLPVGLSYILFEENSAHIL